MPTFANDDAALTAIEGRLESQLFGLFSQYGGIDVLTPDEEPTEPETAGRPYIRLALSEGAQSDEWSAADDRMRSVTVELMVTANDSNGGRTGAANPVSVQAQLSALLQDEFESNYSAWTALGLYDVRVSQSAQSIEGEEDAPIYRKPLRLTCYYEQS